MLTFGSLFAGIGGFDLGLERAGMTCKWQVENDEYCRRVLEKHWPDVRRYGDILSIELGELEYVDVICGGFPCQPVSQAGLRFGEADERWLWPAFFRLVCNLRPRYVLVENTAGLLTLGLGTVLGSLASIRYDAEWQSIPAAAVGAPHLRERVWILAYPRREPGTDENPYAGGRPILLCEGNDRPSSKRGKDWELVEVLSGIHPRSSEDWWLHQSRVDRSVNGISRELVDARNKALGNAVVPQVAEWIGRRIIEYEQLIGV